MTNKEIFKQAIRRNGKTMQQVADDMGLHINTLRNKLEADDGFKGCELCYLKTNYGIKWECDTITKKVVFC